MEEQPAAAYLEEVRRDLRGQKRMAEGALAQLRDEEFFHQLDSEANSVATLMKHMAGNMRSRFTDFLTSDGEKPDRHRDREFEVDSATTRAAMMAEWERGWQRVFDTLAGLAPADLKRTVNIRQQPHSVLQALQRALVHYANHTGQIVLLAKHIRGREWKTLSVPRGKSEELNVKMAAQAKAGDETKR